jgi:hypothetical protein
MKQAKLRKLGGFGCFLTAVVLAECLAATAWAQEGIGVRAGVGVDPDEFYFGGHVIAGPVVDRVWFRPNIEVGLGSNHSTVALNGEFAYWLPVPRRDSNVYFGAGPAMNILTRGPSRARDTSVGPGFNFLVGLAQRRGWFAEIKVGALDSPIFKFGVGYTFPMR